MTKSKIEWTDRVWNPVRGCSLVSEGCRNCYAMKQAHRFSGPGKPFEGLTKQTSSGPKWTGEIRLIESALAQPYKWKKPSMVFVNSMSDLFHEDVPFEFILKVWLTMAECPQHTFQILTKRPERMLKFFGYQKNLIALPLVFSGLGFTDDGRKVDKEWKKAVDTPLPNVWLGVSVEDQKTAFSRIPKLLQAPASLRFVSCEPLLGQIDIVRAIGYDNGIDWIIVGGESGANARPMHPHWARIIRNDCAALDIPFFFKQWGAFLPNGQMKDPDYADDFTGDPMDYYPDLDTFHQLQWAYHKKIKKITLKALGTQFYKYGKVKCGNYLDGRQHQEFPKKLQSV